MKLPILLMFGFIGSIQCQFSHLAKTFEGGELFEDKVLTTSQSPYDIKENIIVKEDATLTVNPGVVLRFSPGVMLAVNGTLYAKGTPDDPIKMTMDRSGSNDPVDPVWPEDIRLVDERSVAFGRLQMLYKGRWRGICANHINWTDADTTVACRQLGFDHGIFSFFPWATNDSTFMLFYQPSCYGSEQNMLQCSGAANIQIGSRICKHQQTIYLNCSGLAPQSPAHKYWWGLEFYNATTIPKTDTELLVRINESSSVLEHVIIEYAGVDPEGEPVPAIRASPTAPFLTNVVLKNCALDGTNFTSMLASTKLQNTEITNNRGHGLVVESHLGRVDIIQSHISENKGNGVRSKFLNGNFLVFDVDDTFCRRTQFQIGTAEVMPIMLTAIPVDGLVASSCAKRFETKRYQRITLSILEMDIEQSAQGTIEVWDGYNSQYFDKIATYDVINGTLPQGITTTLHQIYIRFSFNIGTLPCSILRDCIKVTLLLDTAKESKTELLVHDSTITNNTQYGIFAENIRNFIKVNSSDVSYNKYGAGLRVFGGAGDVQVNSSRLEYNQDNGVNISYGGGWRIFNASSFSNNFGNGINVTLNETYIDNRTRYAKEQKTHVSRSKFEFNEGYGVRVGNWCTKGIVAVNDSFFFYNGWDGVEMESCFRVVPNSNVTNFTVAYNTFEGNYGHAIRVTPMINMEGIISNNTFRYHPRHTLLIDNTDDFLKEVYYTNMPVNYEIFENDFTENEGFYVIHVRLTQGSGKQKLDFKFNHITGNRIQGSVPTLNTRTRAHGVVVLSSSNVNFQRNEIYNTESPYEITTHLLDKNATIQATQLWWRTTDYSTIFYKINDQNSRYDLPKINYYPSLKDPDLYNPIINDDSNEYKPEFIRGDKIGGRLLVRETLISNKVYHVDRDIIIVGGQANGVLQISEGTVLEVENSIAILIQGQLQSDGSESNPIIFRLKNDTSFHNSSLVRLVDGPNEYEGRLEVLPEGEEEWGTVCNEGWNVISASVACQMLGWVVYPEDWGFYDATAGHPSQPIWRSFIRCTELDTDITRCFADDQFDHSCNHMQDVYLKCKPPTWGGIHFLARAMRSRLKHTVITEAGLMDPTVMTYAPAVRIDYNTHTLEHLQIINNVHDGLEIMKNDIYYHVSLRHSIIENNQGNGVSIRTSFFEIENCTIRYNKKSGFEYNPHYTTYEARQLRLGIHSPLYVEDLTSDFIPEDVRRFYLTRPATSVGTVQYILEFRVDSMYKVIFDIIDYNPDITRENVTIYDSNRAGITPSTRHWQIEEDLPDFPLESQTQYLTLIWDVKDVSSGRLSFVITPKRFSEPWPWPELKVKNITTEYNDHGIVTRHYNQPSNEYLDLFFRYRWETITLYGVIFKHNHHEALHVPSITKYHELYLPTFEELQRPSKIAEITYEIDSCFFTENGGGVIAEHNHVEFSNNVWIWQVTNNYFAYNKKGGYSIELPKVNLMYSELYNHSVDLNDTIFEYNENFELRIDGFYCNSSIARNRIQGNICNSGCITISGTEKDFEMHENEIVENEGKYIFELNMHSHTPYTRWVEAQIMFNNFRRNRKPDDSSLPEVSSTPTTYTMSVKGVQNITMNRNLFDNSLDFELIGGYASSSLENYLDVTENWWGSANQEEIQAKIFDFDDWNSYAIAEYYPHLMGSHYDAPLSSEGKYVPEFDPSKPLGGRIEGNLRLPTRDEPYIVNRDLTIMPGGSLIIEKDVEIQFYPNIGILVLGSMSALGYEDTRVRFKPIPKSELQTADDLVGRKKRRVSVGGPLHRDNDLDHGGDVTEEEKLQVRLSGGETPDEGFIEIYNKTERRWALMCDLNFNQRTAEVACKSMGKESSNAIVRRSTLYDHFVFGYPKMHDQLIEWFWRDTFICDGSEPYLDTCRYKLNYNLYTCMEAREYIFMRCGPRNLVPEYEYWGNIRFSSPNFEDGDITPGYSRLEYVDIYGAGILHSEKVAAVQSVHRSPSTENVRLTHCNYNGYDYIAPRGEFEILLNEINHNNGYAFGGLVLNGDSNYENSQSSFIPLKESTIPYNVFGLVRMCTSEKLLHVKNRVLLYYKYEFETVDCIKIMRSLEPNKRVAFRILQMNVYNDSFYENAIELYAGEYFSPDLLITKLDAYSNNDLVAKRRPYQTPFGYDTMGIRVTASAAYGEFGFIAEVVTLPYSPGGQPGLGPGLKHRIADSIITDNEGGGFNFANVGEDNPAVIIELNRIQRNGLAMLNLTSPCIINMFVQNSRLGTIANNYMVGNAGGVEINSTTTSQSDAIYFNITNNVINYNTHGEALHVEGHYFNGFEVQNNFIAFNHVGDRSVVSMFGVRLNYSTNVVFNNTGQCILNASVAEQIDINQNYIHNAFYDNQALSANRSTIFLKSAKFKFRDNLFENIWNFHEMVTYNRTKYADGTYPEVEAQNNWWGTGVPLLISPKVWDRRDDDNLIGVTYLPAHTTNQSVIEGRCYPGWRLLENKKCYLYFGGVVPYREALKECKANRARLAWARDQDFERRFGEIVSSMQVNYNEYWKTWVYSDWKYAEGKCSVLRNYQIEYIECEENLPFVCERDPYIQPEIHWRPISIALGTTGATLFIMVIFIIFAFLKARQRKKDRLKRRTDIRKSVHGSKASVYSRSGARSIATTESFARPKRRRPLPGAASNEFIDISGVTLDDSEDNLDRYKLDLHRRPSTPESFNRSTSKLDQSSYLDSDLGPTRSQFDYYRPPRLENEIPSVRPRGAAASDFDNRTYFRNDAYDEDQSIILDRGKAKSVSSLLSQPRRGPLPSQSSQYQYQGYDYSPSPRNPSLGISEGNLARNIRDKPPRPRPKESAM